jgi:exodeoxyribonuclease V beta subunit
MEARADAGADVVGLDVNWRSDPSVVAAVNAVFSGVPTPFLYEGIPFAPASASPLAAERLDADPAGVGLRILFAERPPGTYRSRKGEPLLINKGEAKIRVASAVAADVAALLSSGARIDGESLDASRIAVLCRTNAQVRRMQEQLARFGVPSVIQTQESVFETDEAEILERVLAAAAEPTNVPALRAAITTPLIGVDAAALRAIDADPEGLDPWLEQADAWHARWRASGTLALVESILHAPGARQRILGESGGERRTTNWLHLAELMESAARTGPRTPPALLRWLVRMRRDARARAEQAGDDALVRLESDARAVQLVTVHRSKGLQYGIVYCPFLWDDRLLSGADEAWPRFHDPDAGLRMTLDVGSAQHEESVARARYEAFAETMRLLYVALTRAEHRVVVAWGAFRGAETSALGCLLHPPPGLAQHVGGGGPDLVEACRTHWKSLDDDAMRADLERLVAASDGTIRLEPVPGEAAPPVRQPRVDHVEGRARTLPAPVLQRRRTSSFTGLAGAGEDPFAPGPPPTGDGGGARLGEDHPAVAGRDYDAASGGPAPATAPGGEPVREDAPVVLHDFPAGAGPGTLIHHVLEHLDFTEPSEAALARGVEDALARFAMPGALAPTLARGLRLALEAPLGGALGDFRLVDLARPARIDEMEFVLPVALGDGQPLAPARLGEAFARHAGNPDVRRYAERASALGFAELAGHLRGFVDLVFRHEDRFYLADYKSNRLGPRAADYAPDRLADEMVRHDYVLQYHVYTVALHRFLAARVPGYAYERDFGGVYYLFVRGMAPDAPLGTGIFHDRPPEALVGALADAFAGEPLEPAPASLGARP